MDEMKRIVPLSLAAAVTFAGIAVASIDPDAGSHRATGDMQAYAPVIDAELPEEAFAVYELMADPGMQSLDDVFCADHTTMTVDLAQNFGETIQTSAALESQGEGTEVWASEDFGTWTVLEVQADGTACVTSSGIGWTDNSTAEEPLRLAGLL